MGSRFFRRSNYKLKYFFLILGFRDVQTPHKATRKLFIRNLEPTFDDEIPDELEDRVEKRDFAEFVRLEDEKDGQVNVSRFLFQNVCKNF